jgi:hypothetical protein
MSAISTRLWAGERAVDVCLRALVAHQLAALSAMSPQTREAAGVSPAVLARSPRCRDEGVRCGKLAFADAVEGQMYGWAASHLDSASAARALTRAGGPT